MKSKEYKLTISTPGSPIICSLEPADRKTVSIRVREDGTVHVRYPYFLPYTTVCDCIEKKADWIAGAYRKAMQFRPHPLTAGQQNQIALFEKKFRNAAKQYIPQRVAYFHQFTGGNYTSITIRDQKSRWGSCSGRGTLSFNYRLMLAPPKILDYVVVHELCHLTYMNHSREFWSMVESVLPDYKSCKKYLRDHGQELTLEHYLFSST